MLTAVAVVFLSVAAWGQATPQQAPAEEDGTAAKLLNNVGPLIQARRLPEALQQCDKVIEGFERSFHDEKTKYFSARTMAESLLYLADSAAKGASAVSVSRSWGDAYFIKAYVLTEMGRTQEAKASLQKALALSPKNSHFLSELANHYQNEKDWPLAISTYELAEAAANEFSPPDRKNAELSRAWRGLAFVAVEQGRLKDAESLYLKCLGLNQNDSSAANELRYVRGLLAKSAMPNSATPPAAVSQSTNPRPDPVQLNDAVHAYYFASLRCDPNGGTRDLTSLA